MRVNALVAALVLAATARAGDNPPTPTTPPRVVPTPPTEVVARVVDARTGAPIKDFRVRAAAVWEKGERLVWQSTDWLDEQTQKRAGEFKLTLRQPAHQYSLRVGAEGHLTEDTGLFTPDGTVRRFTFRLEPAPPVAGRIVTPQGAPVAGAGVFLVTAGESMGVENGEAGSTEALHTKSRDDGSFTLPPQRDDFALLVLCEQGSATLKRQDLASPDTVVRLAPWARLRGAIHIDGKPAGSLQIHGNADPVTLADGTVVIDHRYEFKTREDGTFELPRVTSGRLRLTRRVPNHAPGRFWYVTVASLDLKPGDDAEVDFGRGAAATGRLEIPTGRKWMIRHARAEPKGRPHLEGFENVEVLDDGRFLAHDLAPGEYTLRVALHEFPPDDSCGWGRIVGEYDKQFTVFPGAATTDVGAVAASPITGSALKVGDTAPEFAVRSLDGREVRLGDLKGKTVLIDFWATWCAPCVAELPTMKKLAADHTGDGKEFVIVGLSIDEDIDDLRRFVKGTGITWTQAKVGAESAVVQTYGATAVPLTFLVDPHGRIIARDLRGEALVEGVQSAMKTADQARARP